MHLMRAEILAYNYAQIIADAVFEVEQDLLGHGGSPRLTRGQAASKYQQRLQALQTPIPDKPLHCHPSECRHRPTCYTDYQPNFNPAQQLSSILVGEHLGWKLVDSDEMSSMHLQYGYKDKKVFFEGYGDNKQIHFSLMPGAFRSEALRIYGRSTLGSGSNLQGCLFYLDPYVPMSSFKPPSQGEARGRDGATVYQMSRHAFQLKGNYSNSDDSMHFSRPVLSIPKCAPQHAGYSQGCGRVGVGVGVGETPCCNTSETVHVLTVVTDPSRPDAITQISHLIMF